jgi:hypothetical protein
MDKIIQMFPNQQTPNVETPEQLLARLNPESRLANKALVLLIEDRAGVWKTHWATANMSNAEANLSLDITKDLIRRAILES